MTTLPMFPLGAVVFPGERLPLRVFEPRYRQLVLDCLAADSPVFGTTLIERGSEVGGGDERASVGTVMVLRAVEPIDGRQFRLASIGAGRIRVTAWLPDDPYPRADVEEFPDADPDAAAAEAVGALIETGTARAAELRSLAAQVGNAAAAPAPLDVSSDPTIAGYQLAAAVPLGAADRYRVLQAPSAVERLRVLGPVFDDLEAVLRFRLETPEGPA
jgi:Lon protease-like protein